MRTDAGDPVDARVLDPVSSAFWMAAVSSVLPSPLAPSSVTETAASAHAVSAMKARSAGSMRKQFMVWIGP